MARANRGNVALKCKTKITSVRQFARDPIAGLRPFLLGLITADPYPIGEMML